MHRVLAVVVLLTVGCGSAHRADNKWFRISGEAGIGPTLTAEDVAPRTAKAGSDPVTGEPLVYFGLTQEGVRKFDQLTRRLAHRGARAGRPFHFLVTVDGRLTARPYIDYRTNPDGIPGDNGLQLSLRNRSEAEKLARRLRGG